MKRKILLIGLISLLTALVLSACAANGGTNPDEESDSKDEGSDSMEDMEGHMDHDEEPNLTDSTGENELEIPAALGSESDKEDEVAYTVRAQKGETEIFDGTKTKTLGY